MRSCSSPGSFPTIDLAALLAAAAEAGLDALVEVHDEEELERALTADATLIGVNARDLASLRVDVTRTLPLLRAARAAGATVVAESGLVSATDLRTVGAAGAHAALIGTSLLSRAAPREAAAQLAAAAPSIKPALDAVPPRAGRLAVKVCGLRTEVGVRAATAAGADLAGFVVAPGARRRVSPQQVKELIGGLAGPRPVLVFRRPSRSEVTRAVTASGVRSIQLAGMDGPPRWLRSVGDGLETTIGVVHAADGVRISLTRAEAWLREGASHILLEGATRADGGGTGRQVSLTTARRLIRLLPVGVAGGLTARNVAGAVRARPALVDASSGLERDGTTDPRRLAAFVHHARQDLTGAWRVDRRGRFGRFGGRFVPETLLPALEELDSAWGAARRDPAFTAELRQLHREFIGRPTPLFEVPAAAMADISAPDGGCS